MPPLDGAAAPATIVGGALVAQAATYRPISAPTSATAKLTPRSFLANVLNPHPDRCCGSLEALRLLPELSPRLLKALVLLE